MYELNKIILNKYYFKLKIGLWISFLQLSDILKIQNIQMLFC